MKNRLPSFIGLVLAAMLAGCGSATQPPPPVTSKMAPKKKSGTTLVKLNEGRVLFASRCIECHTLPPVWHYGRTDWPRIIDSMSHRAHLQQAERDAILAYILAARD